MLESAMLAMTDRHVEFQVAHHFAPGVYMRELFIPKGTTLTGKIHKTEHLNILSQGDLSVMTESGVKRLKASTVVKSQPGIKRAGYAHEDSVWITVHHNPDDARDVDLIEERLIAKTFAEIDYLASGRTYLDAIQAHGFTHAQAWAITQREFDQVQFPESITGVCIGDSPIHGKGLFATRAFEKGDVIAPARIAGKRTPGGRYCNHSAEPNSEMRMIESDDVVLIALKPIMPGEEIVNDYFYNFANTRPCGEIVIGESKR